MLHLREHQLLAMVENNEMIRKGFSGYDGTENARQ